MIGLGLSVVQIAVRQLLGFDPKSLFAASEPGVWYDPSDFSTMFQDAAGTTPVTAVEQPVGRILDKSGRGNHATQTTTTSRPVLSARYNLLTKTEALTDAAWTKTAGVTVTDNAAIAPDGTMTASTIAFGTFNREIAQSFSATTSATIPTFYVKGTAGQVLNFGTAGLNLSITLTGGWDIATSTLPAGITKFYIGNYAGNANALNISIWHPDLRPANQASLPYQRVNTATDYDADPSKFKPYLRFDGVDDWLVTPTITPGTDKAQVFAGVRKLSDAARGVVVELSTSTANAGMFVMDAPNALLQNYSFASRYDGVISVAQTNTGTFIAPITNVLAGLGDISGDSAILRVNGTQVAQATNDQGTGKFLAYPLYIGRRGGTTLPFNGHLYGLIVRFGANLPAGTIASTETWLNQKTGAY